MIKKNFIQKTLLNKKISLKLSQNFDKIFKKIIYDINSANKTLSALGDNFKQNFIEKDLRKYKKFKTIVIIGMGGSILGSKATYEFLKDKIKKKFYFIDNIDRRLITKLEKKLDFNKTLFLVISKSGNTIETLSNFFSLDIIKKNKKNIILISEKNSKLFNLAEKFNLIHFEHKNFIGGRFSVLSEVGAIPTYLMSLNNKKLRKKIGKYIINKDKKFLKDSSIKLANLLIQKKYNNLILLNYAPLLEEFLYWYQQLVAESLGKKGKGFLPVISNAPKDHHSLLQLYLDGPKDKIFYIFSVKEKSSKKLNSKKILNQINYLHNKDLNKVKTAQKNALIKSLIKNKIPFREFKINRIDEETLGELFSYYIIETVLIGKLINVNPFDQPAVDQVKYLTKAILR